MGPELPDKDEFVRSVGGPMDVDFLLGYYGTGDQPEYNEQLRKNAEELEKMGYRILSGVVTDPQICGNFEKGDIILREEFDESEDEVNRRYNHENRGPGSLDGRNGSLYVVGKEVMNEFYNKSISDEASCEDLSEVFHGRIN